MSGAYAMSSPWGWFGRCCGPNPWAERLRAARFDRIKAERLRTARDDWFAAMAGPRVGHGPHAYGPWAPFAGQPPFGPPFGPGWGRGGRGKARRGDVRAAILSVLADASLNGYQIIQEIADRSGGAWKPSPGSIYPTLQQLEDEGLVVAETAEGKRTYRLTEDGTTYVAEHAEEVAAPWRAFAEADAESGDESLRPLIGQIAAAIWQIASVGTPDQQSRGRAALVELRRTLHTILAEPDQSTTQSPKNSDGTDEAR